MNIRKIAGYSLLTCVALAVLAPLAWTVLSSLRPAGDIFSGTMPASIAELTLDNYRGLFRPIVGGRRRGSSGCASTPDGDHRTSTRDVPRYPYTSAGAFVFDFTQACFAEKIGQLSDEVWVDIELVSHRIFLFHPG